MNLLCPSLCRPFTRQDLRTGSSVFLKLIGHFRQHACSINRKRAKNGKNLGKLQIIMPYLVFSDFLFEVR